MSLLAYSEALEIVLISAMQRRLPSETVPLVLSAGRTLAEPIVAAESIPPLANSAMDGYAVLAEDVTTATVEAPVPLRVIGESAAGSVFSGTVGRGEAVRIMTGGLLPEGANAVVEVEVTSETDGTVLVRRRVGIGESVRRAGEDVEIGTEVIPSGKRITPGDIGVLATLGVTNVPVRVKPKVGLLATGNEVVEPFRKPAPGQVRNSSMPALYAALAESGAEPIDLGIVGDEPEALRDALEGGLRFDLLLTTGGVSAGSYDLVQHLLPELGMEVKFHGVNIKPGKPILFGVHAPEEETTLVFGLPGNPVSTLVTFRQFVLPAIRALLGQTVSEVPVRAELEHRIRKNDTRRHFIRGILHAGPDGRLLVSSTGTQSSGAMSSMSLANCLIVVDEEVTLLERGEHVTVELL